jgi:hypothetical protein
VKKLEVLIHKWLHITLLNKTYQNIPRLWWETEKLKSENEEGSLCPYTAILPRMKTRELKFL